MTALIEIHDPKHGVKFINPAMVVMMDEVQDFRMSEGKPVKELPPHVRVRMIDGNEYVLQGKLQDAASMISRAMALEGIWPEAVPGWRAWPPVEEPEEAVENRD